MANTVSSRTSPVAGGVVTHKVPGKAQGVYLYLKYNKGDGSGVTILPTFTDPDLDPTDAYQQTYFDSTMKPTMQQYVLSASGNYRIPVPMALGEKVIQLAVTFPDGTTQSLVVDVRNS